MSQPLAAGIRVGGSALPDGVMMLTPLALAIARQQSDGTFTVEASPLPERKTFITDRIPFIRILPRLVGQMALVARGWKPKDGRSPWPLLAVAVVVGVVSSVLNVVLAQLPATWHATTSSLLQLILVFGLIGVTRLIPKFGRIWRFHGGEHQAIAAYESGLDLTVESARTQTLYHPRCGTNLASLALLLMVPGMVYGSMMSGPIGYLVTVLVPVPALCIAFEMVMLGQKRVKFMLWPGLALQRLTVARPDVAQSTAGVLALRAALEEHARVESERALAA